MTYWNDVEKTVSLVYDQKYSGHVVLSLSAQQRSELNAVQDHLQLLRKDPPKFETHKIKRCETNATGNALTVLTKRQDHLTYMKETVLVNPSRLSDAQVHVLVLYYSRLSSRW